MAAQSDNNEFNTLSNVNEGVKYIKISKTDATGNDKTYQILNTSQINLTFSDGSPSGLYHIVEKSEYDSYFVLTVDNVLFNTVPTASDSQYVRYDYDFNISQNERQYYPITRQQEFTSSVWINAFTGDSIISSDENGPNQQPYFKVFQGENQLKRQFYWGDTPSIPMKYKVQLSVITTDGSAATKVLKIALFKNNPDSPVNSPTNVTGLTVPQLYNANNLIGITSTTITNNNIETNTFINEPYSISLIPTLRNITLEGITDNKWGESVGLAIALYPAPGLNDFNPNSVEITNISLEISPHYEIGNNIIAPSSNGEENIQTTFQPDIPISNVNSLELYDFSPFNPTSNNAFNSIKSKKFQKSLRERNTILPNNINKILKNSAEPADVNDYNYELVSHINPRYKGSKYTSSGFNENAKGGLGLPPVEFGNVYFLNCIGAGGQYPEVKDATAFFFNTLIDQNSNVYQSTDDSLPQYVDLQYVFAPGEEVDVNIAAQGPGFIGYDGLSGKSTILGLGALEVLLNTGTGSFPLDYINKIDFEANEGSGGGIVDDYRFTTTLEEDITGYSNYNPIKFNSTIFEPSQNQGFTYDPNTGIYIFSPQGGASNTNALVKFSTQIIIDNQNPFFPNNPDASISLRVKIKKDNTILASSEYITTLNGNLSTILVETSFENFDNGDQIKVIVEDVTITGGNGSNVKIKNNSTLTVSQSPTPSTAIEESSFLVPVTDFGEVGYTSSPSSIFCFSEGISQNIGLTQILSQSQTEGLGYSQGIVVPFDPQPGDEIRWAFTENLKYKIVKVVKPEETDSNRLYIQINDTISDINQKRNHFIIRRYNNNNKQLTTNRPKLFANSTIPDSGKTILSTITPINKSSFLEKNISKIVRNLTNEGIL